MTNKTKSTPPDTAAAIVAHAPVVPVRSDTKVATLIALLTRSDGTTLDQMVTATGWLPHTTRAALTRLKARGYAVTSVKAGGIRTYRASGPAAS
jgi:predicted ArsR family transcriptional regulator